MRKYGTTGAVFFLLVVLVIFVFSLTSISKREKQFTYHELQTIVKDKERAARELEKVTFTNNDSVIQVKKRGEEREQTVVVPTEAKQKLVEDLNEVNVPVDVKDPDKSSF